MGTSDPVQKEGMRCPNRSWDEPRYFGCKPVGLLALGSAGAINVINSLCHATRGLNGLCTPTVVAVPDAAIDRQTGGLRDDGVRCRLAQLATEIIGLSRRPR